MFDVSSKRDDSSAAISFSVSNTTFVHVNDEDSAQSDPGLAGSTCTFVGSSNGGHCDPHYYCWLYTVLFRLYPTRIAPIMRGSKRGGGRGSRTPPLKSQNRVY